MSSDSYDGVTNLLRDFKRATWNAGAKGLSQWASAYVDLASDKNLRVLMLWDAQNTTSCEAREHLMNGPGKCSIFSFGSDLTAPDENGPFADVGIVITGAAAPLAETEALLLDSHWKRAFQWNVLLTGAGAPGQAEGLSDMERLTRQRLGDATRGPYKVKNVWLDEASCFQ